MNIITIKGDDFCFATHPKGEPTIQIGGELPRVVSEIEIVNEAEKNPQLWLNTCDFNSPFIDMNSKDNLKYCYRILNAWIEIQAEEIRYHRKRSLLR